LTCTVKGIHVEQPWQCVSFS